MIFTGIKSQEFYARFVDDLSCMEYLSGLKWPGPFTCRKCGHGEYMKGKQPYSRRCRHCKYDESVTSHTLFHKLKFSLRGAFDLIFQVSCKKKAVSSLALSEELGIHYETCLNFRRKVQKAMESSRNHPLTGNVEVDEFAVGGPDAKSQGRSKGDKKLVSVALEVSVEGHFGRAYAMKIGDYSSRQLGKIFKAHIDQGATVKTDKWTGYLPIKKAFPLLRQELSDAGRNFKELHLHIMNIKGWLRGIHHHVSEKYMQYYLDEFHFRFNRRNSRRTIFHTLVKYMMETPIFLHKQLLAQET